MIVCPECGTRNPVGTQFCGECGTFLEWEEQPATPVATTSAASSSDAAVSSESASSGAASTGAASAGAASSTSTSTSPDKTDKPLDGTASDGPQLVQPDARQRVYHRATGPAELAGPGELTCRNCGIGNAPNRKFCRSCGHPLAELAPEERKSWWRRLIDRLTRRTRYEAGTRRRVSQRRWVRLTAVFAVIAAVLVAVGTILPTRTYVSEGITSLRDRISGHEPVTPVLVKASSTAKDTTPWFISDGVSNRFWAPGTKSPVGQWVEVGFQNPIRLLEIIVTPGVSTDKKDFLKQARPAELAVTVTAKSGQTSLTTLKIQDKPGGQTFEVRYDDVVRVKFTIAAEYGTGKCAIGELEFYKRG